MPGNIPFVDILIFAIIAIFLGFRLHSVLGKRTGFEQDTARDEELMKTPAKADAEAEPALKDGVGIGAIKKAEPGFDEKEFVKGASSAYGMILEAFAKEDTDALKPLLGYEMIGSFTEAIHERQKAGEQLTIELVKLESAKIGEARLVEGLAIITVDYRSRQKRMLHGEDGNLLDGDPKTEETFLDRWTFERDISSRDPNWLLVETETIED